MFSNLIIDPKSICSTSSFFLCILCVKWLQRKDAALCRMAWVRPTLQRRQSLSFMALCNGICRCSSAATFHTRHLSVGREQLVFVAVSGFKFDACPIYCTIQKALFLALWSLKMHYLTHRKYTVPTLQKLLVLWRGKIAVYSKKGTIPISKIYGGIIS